MKKQLIYIAFLGAITLQACKKDRQTEPTAAIVYKTVNTTMDFDHPVLIDMDDDDEPDFHFFAIMGDNGVSEKQYFSVYSEIGSGHKIVVRSEPVEEEWGFWAKAFDKGAEIAATAPAEYKWNANLTTGFLLISETQGTMIDRNGPWLDRQNGYLGVQFKLNGKTHYGWIRLSHENGTDKIKVEDYAYNSIAERAIKAGDK